MKFSQLNHVALHVADIERSVEFYRDVLRLEPIPRPAFTFPGAWFQLGTDQELHIIGERTREVQPFHRGAEHLPAWHDPHAQSIFSPICLTMVA